MKTVEEIDIFHDLVLQIAAHAVVIAWRKNKKLDEKEIIKCEMPNVEITRKEICPGLCASEAHKLAREIFAEEVSDFKAAVKNGKIEEYLLYFW